MKRKHVSKKKSSSWRKNIDITDVDDFLEEKRLEERLGKPFELKTNEELFVVDDKPQHKPKVVTAKEKRKLQIKEPLKCFLALENTSQVEDPNRKRNRVRTPEERKHFSVKLKLQHRRENGIMTPKEKFALNEKIKSYKASDEKLKNKHTIKIDKDIWEEPEKVKPELKCEWFDDSLVKYQMKNLGDPFVRTPLTIREKRSKRKAVELPHPGSSYNPTLEAHTELIEKVIEQEKVHIKKEEHLDRVVTKMFKKVTPKFREERDLIEMSAGLNDSDNELEDDEVEYRPINPPAVNKKKADKTRRNLKKEKEIKFAIQQAKLEKKKASDIQRIKHLKTSIEKKNKENATTVKRKKTAKENSKYEVKKLGALSYEEPDIDIVMPDSMAGSLRTLVPQGRILFDRYKSLQKRNILAPSRARGIMKRAKVKRFVRNTH